MPDTVQANITLNVQGWPELRREVAQIIRDVAATETDARVAARLHQVASLVAQTVAEREAKTLVATVVPHSLRAERELIAETSGRALRAAVTKSGGQA